MKLHSVKRNGLWLLLSLVPSSLLAAPPLQLMASGAQIVTVAGHCPVYLHGVDVSGFEYSSQGYAGLGSPTYPASQVLVMVQAAVTQWNCNFVRIPLNQDLWLGVDGQNVYALVNGTYQLQGTCTASGSSAGNSGAAYQAMVTDVVNWCNANGVYVLLDLHWSGVGTESICSAGQEDMPDSYAVDFWQSVATAFPASSYPGVFFDLYNEPGGAQNGSSTLLTQSDSGWGNWRNGCTETASAMLSPGVQTPYTYYAPGMQALLNAIRSTGAGNMVWAGGINWAYDLTGLAGSAGADGTTSTYWLQDVTWGAGVVYANHSYPWKMSCQAQSVALLNAELNNVALKGVLGSHPVMVTEFGPDSPPGYSCGTAYAVTAATDPQNFIPSMMGWLAQNDVPYTAWNLGSSGPELIYTSTNGGAPSQWSYNIGNPAESTIPPTSYFGKYVEAALTNTAANDCGPTSTPSPTITRTSAGTSTDTPTVSVTPTFPGTSTVTPTFSDTPSASVTPSVSPTFSVSATFTPGPAAGLAPQLFPNPFHPDAGQLLRFGQLAAGSTIHIYDMLGHRVRTLSAVGNSAADTWDGLNDNGRRAITGIYLISINQPSGRHDLVRVAILP